MDKVDLEKNPFQQFQRWYDDASQSDEVDVNAMFLATANQAGQPSIRAVLYKGFNESGFLIYTNYGSRKAIQLEENPQAALALYWPRCYRQIRVEGRAEKLTAEQSEHYFQTRFRGSQIGAWASEQSQEISSREYLVERFQHFEQQFQDKEIPCPEFWGGYCLIPSEVEFWQGQEHRLHDRFCYRRKADKWEIVRLAP